MITEKFDFCTNILSKKKLDFRKAFRIWESQLLQRIMTIFEWKGLDFPQKEIEIILTYIGFCGITDVSGKYIPVKGGMSGATNFPDEFTTFTWSTPLNFGMNEIGETICVINNNQLRCPTYKLVERYAILLAHCDLSFQALLINTRATGMTKARTQSQVDSINQFYRALEDGKTLAILDNEDMNQLLNQESIQVFNANFPSSITIDSYYQCIENLLRSFYSDIGLNSMRDKKERVVTAEVDTNMSRINFNVADMLKERQEGAKQVNSLFGLNWSVDYNPIITKQFEVDETSQKEGVENESNIPVEE